MTLNTLIGELRTQLSMLRSNDERKDAIQRVLEGFCEFCGLDMTERPKDERHCYCMNDE